MSEQPHTDAAVIVAGAGPIGLTVAHILGKAGVPTIVVEALTETIDYPRAVGVDDEALRVMQNIDMIDEVLPHTVPDQKIHMISGEGKVLAEINPPTREFGWPRRNGFVQPLVDHVLLEGVRRRESVDVRMGSELTGVRQDAEVVTVTVSPREGEPYELRARYLVGCEGGSSFTRKALNVPFEGVTRRFKGLVIDVADDPLGNPHAIFGGDPTRPYASIRLPHGIRRWELGMLSAEEEAKAENLDYVLELLRPHVPDVSKLKIIRHRLYNSNARIAGSFRSGRVFLAGDAAHVMPVNAGQGWNSGIRDAANLGWKLVHVVQGVCADGLLDTYDQERQAHVKAMLDLSVNMGRNIASRSKTRAVARDALATVANRIPQVKEWFTEQKFKPLPHYTAGALVPSQRPRSRSVVVKDSWNSAVGRLFPQPRVSATDGRRDVLLDDVTGGMRWRVFFWDNNPHAFLEEDSRAKLAALGAQLVNVVPAVSLGYASEHAAEGVQVIGDHTGAFKTWFDASPFSAFVVRPDNVVAAECLSSEAEATVRRLFAVLRLR